ncbi:MAG TPA: hypothetical protein VGH44_01155 [Candidatus Saccharimonadia bacterium]|jgi:hypothetical protein
MEERPSTSDNREFNLKTDGGICLIFGLVVTIFAVGPWPLPWCIGLGAGAAVLVTVGAALLRAARRIRKRQYYGG